MSCNQYSHGSDQLTTKELAECISNTNVCIFQTDYSKLVAHVKNALNNTKCIKNDAYYDVYGVSCTLVLLCVAVVDNWGVCMGYT